MKKSRFISHSLAKLIKNFVKQQFHRQHRIASYVGVWNSATRRKKNSEIQKNRRIKKIPEKQQPISYATTKSRRKKKQHQQFQIVHYTILLAAFPLYAIFFPSSLFLSHHLRLHLNRKSIVCGVSVSIFSLMLSYC